LEIIAKSENERAVKETSSYKHYLICYSKDPMDQNAYNCSKCLSQQDTHEAKRNEVLRLSHGYAIRQSSPNGKSQPSCMYKAANEKLCNFQTIKDERKLATDHLNQHEVKESNDLITFTL
jgi:hypothetical protein